MVLKEDKEFAINGKQKGLRGDMCKRAEPTPKTAPP